ncbi:helix-turn-helix transcriptional regulator [Muricoccus radiodurans]|uniref:helix-turn-helix transcriptional regulator n=1 Tax=Muricoccus radiodurans TaxID=2231721 RepID=UPI003CF63CD0
MVFRLDRAQHAETIKACKTAVARSLELLAQPVYTWHPSSRLGILLPAEQAAPVSPGPAARRQDVVPSAASAWRRSAPPTLRLRPPRGALRNRAALLLLQKRREAAMNISLGARLRELRAFLGMTSVELGDALGTYPHDVHACERGMKPFGAGQLFNMARAMEVPVDLFLDEKSFAARPDDQPAQVADDPPQGQNAFAGNVVDLGEAREFRRAFSRVTSPELRETILSLMKSLAGPS